MNNYNCEIIADSKNPQGDRITTMKITFPRFVLAELNTHRMFSRNSASSRAIPFKKMVKMVTENPFIPLAWQKDHKGMQGTDYFTSEWDIKQRNNNWLFAKDAAISTAKLLNEKNGVTKQLCNRLLEPFMWHTVILTSTEFSNFFKLRCPQYRLFDENMPINFKSKKDIRKYIMQVGDSTDEVDRMTEVDWLKMNKSQADIHIQAIAELMWDSYNESTPKELEAGQWHIPFGDNMDYVKLGTVTADHYMNNPNEEIDVDMCAAQIATARCARISYQTLGDDPKIDYNADIKLHNMLSKMEHWSPFEHCAKAMTDDEYQYNVRGKLLDFGCDTEYHDEGYEESVGVSNEIQGWCRNFKGFIQYRDLISND